MTKNERTFAAVLASLLISTALHAQTVYVNAAATGANDGTSWADAYTSLQSALALPSPRTIWIAEGTYKPGSARTSTFTIDGKTVYGGFAGTETDIAQRDLASHQTILSGEIGAPGLADNVGNVVTVSSYSATATLDGLVITGGNTDGAGALSSGGGIAANGSLSVANCRIIGNQSTSFGGGIFAYGNATIVNTVFFRNSAYSGSAVIFFNAGTIVNCTISGNVDQVGTIYFVSSPPTVQNTILWANAGDTPWSPNGVAPVSSIVEGTGADPLFADIGGGDFHLSAGSPAINAGTAVAQTIDADGAPRVSGAAVDIGAFEFANNRLVVTRTGSGTGTVVSTPPAINCGTACAATLTTGDTYQLQATADPGFRFLGWGGSCSGATTCVVQVPASVTAYFGHVWYVNTLATGANDGTSWTNAFTDVQNALAAAAQGDEIWVAAGTYTPAAANIAISFNLRSGVAIYGGFNGNETNRDQRNASANVTTLSGDLGASGHSNNVVLAVQVDAGAVLDGFTITGGSAVDAGINQRGGGIFMKIAHPRIAHCTISGNMGKTQGGGINVDRGGGVISDCVISNNVAVYDASPTSGGGIAIGGTRSFVLRDSTLVGNTGFGGAIYVSGGSFLIDRCRIRQNSNFPTVYISESFPNFGSGLIRDCEIIGTATAYPVVDATSGETFLNCTIVGPSNPSGLAGAMSIGVSPTNVYNTILWGASDPSKNFYYNGYGVVSSNLSTTNPQFATGDPANGNYRPGEGSPAIDAGNNTVAAGNVLDLDGKLRPVDDPQTADTGTGSAPFIDIGAYELHPVTVSVPASVGACVGSQVTLTATASGYGTLTYQWRKALSNVGSATTSPSYVIDPYASVDAGLYDVVVTDSLGSSATSSQIDVHDSSISLSGFNPPNGAGGDVVAIDGSGFTPVTDVQFNGVSATITNLTDTQITVTVPLAATTGTIKVVTPGCQATSAGTFTVPPFGPPVLTATANSQTSIALNWTRVGGISGYIVKRIANSVTGYETLTTNANGSFTDTTALADHAYVYRIDAVPAGAGVNAESNRDLVTTFVFADAIAQNVTKVKGTHWTELRDAVSAVHVLAGLGTFDFTNTVAAGETIKLQDLDDLRTALANALSALVVPAVTFTDTLQAGVTPVRKQHMDEIRSALQ